MVLLVSQEEGRERGVGWGERAKAKPVLLAPQRGDHWRLYEAGTDPTWR